MLDKFLTAPPWLVYITVAVFGIAAAAVVYELIKAESSRRQWPGFDRPGDEMEDW